MSLSSAIALPLLIHGTFNATRLIPPIAIPASVLALLLRGPDTIALPLLSSTKKINLTRLKQILLRHKSKIIILLVLSTIRTLNRLLNAHAASHWRSPNLHRWNRWPEEIAVVTGGSSGIGRALTLSLARKEMTVCILDISPPSTHDAEVTLLSHKIHYFKCDITSPDSVSAAASQIRQRFPGREPSILCNNAGVGNDAALITTSNHASVQRLLAINLTSLWITTREFLPAMVAANKGHVINTASMASFAPLPGAADYAASKAGALAFHENLTLELRHAHKSPGVVATCIHPSWVRTGLTESFVEELKKRGAHVMEPGEIADRVMEEHVLLGRGGQVIAPRGIGWFCGVRGAPNWVQEMLRDGAWSNVESLKLKMAKDAVAASGKNVDGQGS